MQSTETEQFVTGISELDVENESDSDIDGTAAVREIKQKRACCAGASNVAFIVVSIIVLLVITAVAVSYLLTFTFDPTTNEDALVINYVLANDTVVVSTSNDTIICGQFRADAMFYDFYSVSSDITHYIQFINSDRAVEDWNGFRIEHSNGSRLTIELINVANGAHKIAIGKNETLAPHDIMLFDAFWGSKIGKHYVELSMKLGVLGYNGDSSHAIEQLHRFAIWIWSFIDSEQLHPWFDLVEEQEKLDAISTASDRAGHRIQTMDELIRYTSDLESQKLDHGRSLLQDYGNCGEPFYHCDNPCFGMCGLRCRCIRRVCGNCGCWLGCYVHDHYCSCEGMTHPCCIDVFAIRCHGSNTCT